ncbi:MAG: FG-GAP-like repeat-containing protein, partial [Actinomycetales bacterium]|nr:FG-GAP-like repeat-containing protein [Actinomycetales bacterium]
MVLGLTVATASVATAAPSAPKSPTSTSATPTTPAPSRATTVFVTPLRAATVLAVPTVDPTRARARIEQLLRRYQKVLSTTRVVRRPVGATASGKPGATAGKPGAPALTAQQKADAAKAEADRRLKEALDALAKALSTSSCQTVGGTNGSQASISCPLDNNGQASISGGNANTTVTTASPAPSTTAAATPTATSTATPTPSPSTTPDPQPTPMTAVALPTAPVDPAQGISAAQLDDALATALAEWSAAFPSADLSAVTASVGDLTGTTLGATTGASIVIDADAAGWGWGVDFAGDDPTLHMDLVTVVRHEIGHALGLDHAAAGLMAEDLAPGETRLIDVTSLPLATTTDPTTTDPTTTDPTTTDPTTTDPTTTDPTTTDPTTTDPAATDPPTTSDPAAIDPATTTDPGTAVPPTTSESATGDTTSSDATGTTTSTADLSGMSTATWSVDGDVATLTLAADGSTDGTLSYDAATGSLVYTTSDATTTVSADGVVHVQVQGGAGDDAVMVDLADAPVGLDVVVDGGTGSDSVSLAADAESSTYTSSTDGSVQVARGGAQVRTQGVETVVDGPSGSVSLGADGASLEIGPDPDRPGHVLVSGLFGSVFSFAAPLLRAVLDAGTGGVRLVGDVLLRSTGADLVVRGRSIHVLDGVTVDTRGSTRIGDITLSAHDEGDGTDADTSAAVDVRGATLLGGAVSLLARSASSGSAAGAGADVRGASSASVVVVDSRIESASDVSLVADSSAAGSAVAGGSAPGVHLANVTLVSRALARLGGASSVRAAGGLRVNAVNRTDATATAGPASGAGVATASVERSTEASVDGGSAAGIAAASVDVAASSSGSLTVTSAGTADGPVPSPYAVTAGLAATTDGPMTAASAIGFGRTLGRTVASLVGAPGGGLVILTPGGLTVSASGSGDSRVAASSSVAGSAAALGIQQLLTRAYLDGALALTGPSLAVAASTPSAGMHVDSSATGAGATALTVAVNRLETNAGVLTGASASLDGTVGLTSTSAADTTANGASGDAGRALVIAVVDDSTASSLGDDSSVTGAGDLASVATATDTSRASAPGRAGSVILVSTVTTSSLLGSGGSLNLAGDLDVSASQTASAVSTATFFAVTIGRHTVRVTTLRAIAATGSVELSAYGWTSTSALVTPWPAAGLANLGDLLSRLNLAADAAAARGAARGPGQLAVPAAASVDVGAAAIDDVLADVSATVPPDLPLDSGGPVRVPVDSIAAATSAVASGGHGLAVGPAVALTLGRISGLARVSANVVAGGDLTVRAGRGPPAADTISAAGPVSTTLVSRSLVATLDGTATFTTPTASARVLSDAAAPAQLPAFAPPAGSVLVSAALGGTVTVGAATLTFAPGALPADAWVHVTETHRGVTGLLLSSAVFDLVAYDARTGALIESFRSAPRLTIGVGGGAAGSTIYYLDPSGRIEAIPTTVDTSAGTVTALLPHFSAYGAGSPLAGLAAPIISALQQYLADAVAEPRTQTLSDVDLSVLTVVAPTISFAGITGTTDHYTTSVSISATITVNLTVGGRAITGTAGLTGTYVVSDQALDAGTFGLTLTNLHLGIADVVVLDAASASLTQTSDTDVAVSATSVTASFNAPGGPSLQLSATSLDLLLRKGTANSAALRIAGGTVSLTGVPQVAVSGTGWTLVYNGTGGAVSLGTPATSVPATPELALSGDASITVLGQPIAGSFVVTRSGDNLSLAVTNLALTLGDLTAPAVGATGSATLTITPAGTSGSGTLALTVPSLGLLGTTLGFTVNTTDAVVATIAAKSLTVSATLLTLSVAGVSVQADVTAERVVTSGTTVTRVTLANGQLSIGSLLSLQNVAGSLQVSAAGIAGTISGDVVTALTGTFAVNGTVSVAVNTTSTAVGSLPAGPYLRVEVDNAVVTVGSQTMTADLAFEKVDGKVRVGVADASLTIRAGSSTIASLSGGSGVLLLLSTGEYAGQVAGTVAVTVPGVTATGSLLVQLNTGSAEVDETFLLAGVSTTLHLAGGPYLRVAGTGITLTVLGQTSLTGDVEVVKGVSSTTITVRKAQLVLADGLATFSYVPAHDAEPDTVLTLTADAAGVDGSLTGTLSLAVPQVTLTGTISAQFNTRAGHELLRVGGANLDLTVAGQTLSGEVWLERSGSAGAAVVTVTLTGVGLTIGGGAVTVGSASGTFTVAPDGVAGSVSATATVALNGLLSATGLAVSVSVNTRPTAVELSSTVTLPAGPYTRVEITADTSNPITLASFGTLTGAVSVQRSQAEGQPSAVTVVAFADAAITLTGAASAGIDHVNGVLVLKGAGFAGYVSGRATAALSTPNFSGSIGANVLVRGNTTGGAVDEVAVVGGQEIHIQYAADLPLTVSLTGAKIVIGDYVYVEGDVTYDSSGRFAGRNLTVFAGDGPYSFDDGSINPVARGLLITNASVGVIRFGTGTYTYALTVQGDVALVGFDGVTVSGTIRVRVNQQTVVVDPTDIDFGDGAGSVTVAFGAGEVATGTTPFVSVAGIGLTVAVADQSFTADLSFTKVTGGFSVTVANLALELTDGGTPLASFTNGVGTLAIDATGVAGFLTGTVAVTVPDVSLSGTILLEVNTRPTSLMLDPGVDINGDGTYSFNPLDTVLDDVVVLPAGPYVRLVGLNIGLTVAGQVLTAERLEVERTTSGGATVTRVTVAGGTLDLAGGDLVVDQVEGLLVVSASGVAGRLSAHATTTITGLSLGTVSLTVNSGGTAVGDIPAGPFLRLEVVGAGLDLGGQHLSADLAFQRSTAADGTVVTVAVVTHLTLVVSAGTSPVLSITDGSGLLLVTGTGVAADVAGTVALSVPGVSLGGSLRIQVNSTGALVNQTVTVAGEDLALVLPANSPGTPYAKVVGTGVTLGVLGQQLSGDIAVVTDGTTTTIDVTDASLVLGGGLLSVTGASAHLTVHATGLAGTFSGSVEFGVPGISLAATVTVSIDTRPSATVPLVVTATGVDVTVAGQRLHGDISVVSSTAADGSAVLKVAVANTDSATSLLTLTTGSTTIVDVKDATGQLLITSAGVAGALTVTSLTVTLPGLTVTTGVVRVEVSTIATPVDETFTLGAVDTPLSLPAGPFVRVELVSLDIAVVNPGSNSGTAHLSGNFAFESRGTGTGSRVVVGVTGLTVSGIPAVSLTEGEGAFVVLGTGIAGYVTGKAALSIPGADASATALLRFNTTTDQVDESITVAGRVLAIKFATGDVFDVTLSNAALRIGDFVTIEGSVTFQTSGSDQVFAGTGLTVFLGQGPYRLASGELNPLAVGVALTNGTVGLVKRGTTGAETYALVAGGTVSLVGVEGVVLAGDVEVRVNTLGAPITTSIEIPGSTEPPVVVSFATAAGVKQFQAVGATLQVGGQSLVGTYSFELSATGETVVVATGVSASLGGAVTIADGSAAFVVGPDGVVGQVGGGVSLTVPGVAFSGTLRVAVNTTTAAVSRTLTAGGTTILLDLPAGPYLQVEGTGISLTIAGQTISADLSVTRGTNADGPVTLLALANVNVAFGTGATYGVRLSDGSGLLVVTSAGVAGRLSGTLAVSLPAGISLSGSLALAINSTPSRVTESATVGTTTVSVDVPGGPYVRFDGTGITLTVLGQSLSGDLSIERSTSYGADKVPGGGDDVTVLKVAVAHVSVSLGGVLSVTEGSALVLVRGDGLAGRITGTIALTVPQVSLSGSLAVEINTTASAIDESFLAAGAAAPQSLVLTVPGPYVRVVGTGVTLTVAGQSLAADVQVVRQLDAAGQPVVRVRLENLALRLGGTPAAPIVTVTQAAGSVGELVLASDGLAGHLAVTVAVAVTGVTLTGAIALDVNTRPVAAVVSTGASTTTTLPAGPYLRVSGDTVSLTVLGQTLAGSFVVEQVTGAGGAKVVRLGVSGGTLDLLGSTVRVTGVTGLVVLTPTGAAADFSASLSLSGIAGFALSGALRLQVNTTGTDVNQSLQVGAQTVSLALPAGPYLRVVGTGITLAIGDLTPQTLRADVAVERVTVAGVSKVRVFATNVSAAIGDGTRTIVTLSDGEALVLLTAGGVAASARGTLAVTGVPGVTASGTLAVELNNTSGPVDETFTINGLTKTLTLAAGSLAVRGTGITLVVAGQSLSADITITRETDAVTVSIANGSLSIGTATTPLLTATAIAGSFTMAGTGTKKGLKGSISATIVLGVPSVSLSGSFQLTVDTTGGSSLVRLETASSTTAALTIAGVTVTAGFSFQRVTVGTRTVVDVTVTNLSTTFGGIVSITGWSGSLRIAPEGVSAYFTGTATFTLGSAVSLTGGTMSLQINNATVPVTVPDGGSGTVTLPAGPFVQIEVKGASLVAGGFSFGGTGSTFLFSKGTRPGFTASSLSALGTASVSVATGDVDGDGTLDVVQGTASGAVVYLGTGPNAFASGMPPYSGGSGTVVGARLFDVTGDGLADLVVLRAGQSAVYENLGRVASAWLGFRATPALLTTADATSVAAGDLNNDGLADLVVVGARAATPGADSLVFSARTSTTTADDGSSTTSPVSISATGTTLTVTDTTGFPTSGTLLVGAER